MYRKSVTGIKIHVLNLSLYIHKQNINFKSLNKMQKMIFSVIALVAFSFAGMANEIEEKKVEVKSNKKVKFIDTDMTLRVWDALYGGSGLTEQEEARFMNIFIALCEGYPSSSIIN